MVRQVDSSVAIILDRWPTTETEFEGLISSLRLSPSKQKEGLKRKPVYVHLTLHFKPYISMILLNECDWKSDCMTNLVLWELGHV
jgi:hypothetical protein